MNDIEKLKKLIEKRLQCSIMIEKRINQSILAKELWIDWTTLSRIISWERMPKLENIKYYIKILNEKINNN